MSSPSSRARRAAPPGARPTHQARSLKTLDRLLRAAEELLETEGLEAATVPRIARRAGLSVGVVYRRFPNKDALLRALYDKVVTRVGENNRLGLRADRWIGVPPERIVRALVAGMVAGYRLRPGLLRALFLYAQTHPDRRFRRRADRMNAEAVGALVDLLLPHRARMRHHDPELAIRFSVMVTAFLLRGQLLAEPERYRMLAPPPERLAEELTRMILGYLGLAPERGRRPK